MTAPLAPHDRRYRPTAISCACCGQRHVVERPTAKFCSARCRKRAARAARGADDRVRCKVCGVARPPAAFGRSKTCRLCRRAIARVRRAARVASFLVCRRCKVAKPVVEFYSHPTSRTGRASTCTACCRALARLRRAPALDARRLAPPSPASPHLPPRPRQR